MRLVRLVPFFLVFLIAGCVPGSPVRIDTGLRPHIPTDPGSNIPPEGVILRVAALTEPPMEETPPYDPYKPRDYKIYTRSWTREVVSPGVERITLELENGYTPAAVRLYFAGLKEEAPYAAYVWVSDTYDLPSRWRGTLTFEVELGEWDRVFFVQYWMGWNDLDPYFSVVNATYFVPPYPDRFPCPPYVQHPGCLYDQP